MSRITALIQRGVARFDFRAGMGEDTEFARRKRSLRSAVREREPQASAGQIIAARALLCLAGINFVIVGFLLVAAGSLSISLISILVGLSIVSASGLLLWLAVKPSRNKTCSAPVVVLAEFFARILG